MGSKKTPLELPGAEGQPIAVWLSAPTIPKLDDEAEKRGISRSATAREIILNYFKSRVNSENPTA